MNEKIRELAKQAGAQEISKFDFVDLEKFAELIVRECASVCESATQEGQPLHLVSIGYADRIKQHFGVDE